VDKQTIEILKNPYKHRRYFRKGFLDSLNFDSFVGTDHVCIRHKRINTPAMLFIFFDYKEVVGHKLFILSVENQTYPIRGFEKCFEFPLLPTKEERELFYREHGFEYPIPCYEGEL